MVCLLFVVVFVRLYVWCVCDLLVCGCCLMTSDFVNSVVVMSYIL